MTNRNAFIILFILLFCFGVAGENSVKKTLTFSDLMKFRTIQSPKISENGRLAAYVLEPGRGDPMTMVHRMDLGTKYELPLGNRPQISRDSRWVGVSIVPSPALKEKGKNGDRKSTEGALLLDSETGEKRSFERIERWAFSCDSRWMILEHMKEEKKPENKVDQQGKEEKDEEKNSELVSGSTLELVPLMSNGKGFLLQNVHAWSPAPEGSLLLYSIADPTGEKNGIFLLDPGKGESVASTLRLLTKGLFSGLTWDKGGKRFAFISAVSEKKGKTSDKLLQIWECKGPKLISIIDKKLLPSGWSIPFANELKWTKDGERLFFGIRPDIADEAEEDEKEKERGEIDPFDPDAILAGREVDVWHYLDPWIFPRQRREWTRESKKLFLAVFHVNGRKVIPLADDRITEIRFNENRDIVLGFDVETYRRGIMPGGALEMGVQDIYSVDLHSGTKKKILERLKGRVQLSPLGRYLTYYQDKDWWLYEIRTGNRTNLTGKMGISFSDEEFDAPDDPPAYGFAAWDKDDRFLYLYDRYDLWKFNTRNGVGVNVTAGKGRKLLTQFRIVFTDREERDITEGNEILLRGNHERDKTTGFFRVRAGTSGVEALIDGKKKFEFVARAKKQPLVLFTREDFREFPDLWRSGPDFSTPMKISDANPQIKEFRWGNEQLVEWLSLDGIPLQGVLITPEGEVPPGGYPMIVYFYERMSDRLYSFNEPVINHRPSFPVYTSNGYAVFLPDIVFETGHPGQSSLKCLLPGVQKVIEMGLADPKAVGLHGHSWGGYETAYLVTQTKLFAAAVAGAPVSNMTSAYDGIRWQSGMDRQWQYELSQSRIGRTLFEAPHLYIENSPVFHAERVETPLLIEFGDEDGAVPWYQGIELYLAMRRLNKNCIMLVYRGEPHHLQKYPNKLDYSIKMKEYFDHYLKGTPAPDWITRGSPYSGGKE